jgi:hypothetical protein
MAMSAGISADGGGTDEADDVAQRNAFLNLGPTGITEAQFHLVRIPFAVGIPHVDKTISSVDKDGRYRDGDTAFDAIDGDRDIGADTRAHAIASRKGNLRREYT